PNANKASIVFTLPHKHGALAEMLDELKDVNLTKIQSRPMDNFEYRFYVDFEAENPMAVIERLEKKYNTIRVLGVYRGR
ncbi:MAG: bifunctional chorismate mutase/prephenate dehydratase, partial [Clostridia bacterium]|nr:bifunctional chorismate mutase/prephenate dehydratase [Clostridia bacterium]